jgi:hypothetical protein
MKTIKLLSAASVAMLALGCAAATLSSSSAAAQGYGTPPPPPPPEYVPPPSDYTPPPPDYAPPTDYPDRSLLKVCKIAKDIPIGSVWTFYTEPGGQKQSVRVPVGPAPHGYCQVVGEYPTGSTVVLHEYLPKGYTVYSIHSDPAGAALDQNLREGWIRLKLPRGVTEVYWVQTGTGMIEICKIGGRPGTNYTFNFTAVTGPMSVTIPHDSCSPAYEVPAGHLVVTEANAQGQMTGGEAWPANRLVSVDPAQGQVIVDIQPGTLNTQTIVTFKNRTGGKGY